MTRIAEPSIRIPRDRPTCRGRYFPPFFRFRFSCYLAPTEAAIKIASLIGGRDDSSGNRFQGAVSGRTFRFAYRRGSGSRTWETAAKGEILPDASGSRVEVALRPSIVELVLFCMALLLPVLAFSERDGAAPFLFVPVGMLMCLSLWHAVLLRSVFMDHLFKVDESS